MLAMDVKVREALKENSVQTFAFDSKSIKIIESKHSEEADETFQPLCAPRASRLTPAFTHPALTQRALPGVQRPLARSARARRGRRRMPSLNL